MKTIFLTRSPPPSSVMSSFFTAKATPLFGSVHVWAEAAPADSERDECGNGDGSMHGIPLIDPM